MKRIGVEELHKYYAREYGDIWPIMLEILEGFAYSGPDKERAREYILNPFGYLETSLEYESMRDAILFALRKGKPEKVNPAQLKEFLPM